MKQNRLKKLHRELLNIISQIDIFLIANLINTEVEYRHETQQGILKLTFLIKDFDNFLTSELSVNIMYCFETNRISINVKNNAEKSLNLNVLNIGLKCKSEKTIEYLNTKIYEKLTQNIQKSTKKIA